MKRVRVRGHRTYTTNGEHKIDFTVWGWRCLVCNEAGGSACDWRSAYDEGNAHARACNGTPLQLIYAVRGPSWNWFTDPIVAHGIPGTSHEAEAADSSMAVRYMSFAMGASMDRQAAVVIKDGKNGVRVLDMTPVAAQWYRQNWLQAENA